MKRSRDIFIVLLMIALIATWIFHLSGRQFKSESLSEHVANQHDSLQKIFSKSTRSCDSVLLITTDSLQKIEKQLRLRIDTLEHKWHHLKKYVNDADEESHL